MGKNIKFHAIAIALICGVITVLYVFIGPKPAKQEVVQSANGRTIKIVSATWGENCNAYMAQAMEDQNAAPAEHDANGNVIPKPILKPVVTDNVLQKVAAVCDGKPMCEFFADVTTTGVDPLPSCYKRLVTSYRCFSFDRLTSQDISRGETLKIDCSQTEPAANAPAKQ